MPAPRSPIVLTIVITTSAVGTAMNVLAEREQWDDSADTRACLDALRPIVATYANELAKAVPQEVSGHAVVGDGLVMTGQPTSRRAGRG